MTPEEKAMIDFLQSAKECFGSFELEVVMQGNVFKSAGYDRLNKKGTWISPSIEHKKGKKNADQ